MCKEPHGHNFQSYNHNLTHTKQVLGVTGTELTLGLEICDTAHSDKEQKGANVISEHNRGATHGARQKCKKADVGTSMSHKLVCSNITSLVTYTDIGKHEIADNCQQW